MIGFLLDENIPFLIRTQLLAHNPLLRVYRVGDGTAPPTGTLDPDILYWIEDHDCLLVTYNRKSMPNHLADHLAQGHHVPGILQLRKDLSTGAIIEELIFIAGASLPNEHRD